MFVQTGYAMTSGRYFSDRIIYYAIGAPRADLTGKVSKKFTQDLTSTVILVANCFSTKVNVLHAFI